ncbi:MAG: ATP-dependent nuclease [Terracidiphilus sp.]
MKPRIWVESAKFSDGSEFNFSDNDVVIIVGPNNCGKSETLRGIRNKLSDSQSESHVLDALTYRQEGSETDLMEWLRGTTKFNRPSPSYMEFETYDKTVTDFDAKSNWKEKKGLGKLTRFFCLLLSSEQRLKAANPPASIAVAREPAEHPIHVMQWDERTETRVSEYFKRAFGEELAVHRNSGREVPIVMGSLPKMNSPHDRFSLEYVHEIDKLPGIHTQGDGMRSFLGVLLYTLVGSESVLLVDEPEAFLHPPQARHLGKVLASQIDRKCQLFIATHSGDALRGLLDSSDSRVRVIRLRRDGDKNVARQLKNGEIAQIWNDPLLRYSNILDGLFHDRALVCEGDADCRFYSAVMDAIAESNRDQRRPDIMFTHCGGKARVPLVLRSLNRLEVPTSVVVDFDVLSDEEPLKRIVEAAGGDWPKFKNDWKAVKSAIDSMKPELPPEAAKAEIKSILSQAPQNLFPDSAKKQIRSVLQRSSAWSVAKSIGFQFIPSGQASEAAGRLKNALEEIGIFIVPVGELEQFVKTAGAHGPSWVTEALRKDLRNDPELSAARQFVAKVTG